MPLTPIEALLDVNVIIASIFADHVSRMANLDDAANHVLFVVK